MAQPALRPRVEVSQPIFIRSVMKKWTIPESQKNCQNVFENGTNQSARGRLHVSGDFVELVGSQPTFKQARELVVLAQVSK